MTIFYLDSGGASPNSGTTDSNSPTCSGTTNASVVSNKTFTAANVNTGTDVATVTAHGYTTGTMIILVAGGTIPTGLSNNDRYFIRAVDADTIAFYHTPADAIADTNRIDITGAGSGTNTINNMTVNVGGSPDLSSIPWAHPTSVTTGTSHVLTYPVAHGLNTGDTITARSSLIGSGAFPSGPSLSVIYYVNALSSTTLRLYETLAAAQAGGASGVNLTGAGAGAFQASGDNQQWIYMPAASNSNKRNFAILGVENTNKLVYVDTTPTGVASSATWGIGGRFGAIVVPTAGATADLMNAIRGGDKLIQNTDITLSTGNLIMRGITPGVVRWTGKSGARRVLTNQGNGTLLNIAANSSKYLIENIEFQSQGTGAAINPAASALQLVMVDCRITDSGTAALTMSSNNGFLFRCEFTGASTLGYSTDTNSLLYQCYVHDNGSGANVGVAFGSGGILTLIDSIIERGGSGQRGVSIGVNATNCFILGSTIYKHTSDGVGPSTNTQVSCNSFYVLINNIFKDNGDASTEANVNYIGGFGFVSRDSCYSIDGATGGVNFLNGFAADASDVTSDPLFVDPDNGTVSSRNFGLQSGSPCKGKAFTFLGGGSISYRDMGAVQRQEATSLLRGGDKRAGMQ